MTERAGRGGPGSRRSHRAATSRGFVTGVGFTAMFALIAGMANKDATAARAAEAAALLPPVTTAPTAPVATQPPVVDPVGAAGAATTTSVAPIVLQSTTKVVTVQAPASRTSASR